MRSHPFPEMPEKSSTDMRKKGSITVFLSLLLVLIVSFVLTALEAARIRGATAYVSMLSGLAADSFLASYYYPLFKEYRIFGVSAGDEKGFFDESILTETLKENLSYGTKNGEGGLIKFTETEVCLEEYETLLSKAETGFLSQVQKQVVLDGASLALSELFPVKDLQDAGNVGEVYRRQEEAMEAVATVTGELLNLMQLTDGIKMSGQGIAFDKNGKMQAEESFIKQLVCMEQGEVKAAYGNAEVFRCISGKFYRADRAAARIRSLLFTADTLESSIFSLDVQIGSYQSALEDKEKQWEDGEKEQVQQALKAAKEQRESEETQRSSVLSEAKADYEKLQKTLQAVEKQIDKALDIVKTLEKKQVAAKVSVQAYESFLAGKSNVLSEELGQYFESELVSMKVYAGMEENGYRAETMQTTLETDKALLEALSLGGFQEERLSEIRAEMERIIRRMPEYSVDGLWFSYGDIVVAKTQVDNVLGTVGTILSNSILSLVGISEDSISGQKLTGKDLVSAGLEKTTLLGKLLDCIPDATQLLKDGNLLQVVRNAGNGLLEETALELYAMKYFHCYGETSPYTKLNYEREYLLFGAEQDKTNLLSMVLTLAAVRMLFCMVMILKQPERMESLDAISLGIAGFTGMPALGSVVKYSILVLWSVEEALVEVAALLQGKRVALIGSGCISLGEVFLFSKGMITQKAESLSGSGPNYKEYLTLFSLAKGTRIKAYRAMDLIQENIRYRYNDGFRIRNLVTELRFTTTVTLKKQFDTGVFPEAVYQLKWQENCAY